MLHAQPVPMTTYQTGFSKRARLFQSDRQLLNGILQGRATITRKLLQPSCHEKRELGGVHDGVSKKLTRSKLQTRLSLFSLSNDNALRSNNTQDNHKRNGSKSGSVRSNAPGMCRRRRLGFGSYGWCCGGTICTKMCVDQFEQCDDGQAGVGAGRLRISVPHSIVLVPHRCLFFNQ